MKDDDLLKFGERKRRLRRGHNRTPAIPYIMRDGGSVEKSSLLLSAWEGVAKFSGGDGGN